MQRRQVSMMIGAAPLLAAWAQSAGAAESMREEAVEHPRIAAAIRELEEAIRYMEAAPHDFGGHKAEAIRSSRQAVTALRRALAFRARRD